jgi:NAD+ kinase
MSDIKIISYNNFKSKNIKKVIEKKLKNFKSQIKNLIIVIGGDGFMLRTLKKNYNKNNFYYGINSGNYGFLMNKFSKKDLLKNILNAKQVQISPLQMLIRNKGNNKKILAINEVSILRQSRQTSLLQIKINNKIFLKKLISDGILVSTPAGSTAYNLSVNGPILSLNSKKLSIMPISPFRPRRWIGKIVSDKSKITIKNLDTKKRPISAVADNIEIKNAKFIKIETNNKFRFNLLHNSNKSLQEKINIEKYKKKTEI